MIVQCRSCEMRYHLDDGVLGSKGCQVRCTACGHIWHQNPPESKNMLIKVPKESEKAHQEFSVGTKIIIAMASFSIVGCVSFYLGRQSLDTLGPWVDGWIELLRSKRNKPALELTSFSFQTMDDGKMMCQGSVRNLSDRVISAPKIQLTLCEFKESGKKSIQKRDHVLDGVQIPSGQSQTFSFSLPPSNCSAITASIPDPS